MPEEVIDVAGDKPDHHATVPGDRGQMEPTKHLGYDHLGSTRAVNALWIVLIVTSGTCLSTFFACATPFAALATLAALKLGRRDAITVIGLVWLANQVIGYGFLGYPLLQSADILLYRAQFVPVGEDQVAHVEITREVARRFNHIYGREPEFEQKVEKAIKSLGSRNSALYRSLRKAFQEKGDADALAKAQALVEANARLTVADRDRLLGFLEGVGIAILPEPEALLTATPKVPGLDGRKMSKSYNNTIGLREDTDSIVKKLKAMQTDPARVRRTDPGDPDKCPVWDLHKIYSTPDTQEWVQKGCRSAGIGCLECKAPLIEKIVEEVSGIAKRAQEFEENPELVRGIIAEGCERARTVARDTMDAVRQAMAMNYR